MRSCPAGLYGPKTCDSSRGASGEHVDARSAQGHLRIPVARDIAQLGRNGTRVLARTAHTTPTTSRDERMVGGRVPRGMALLP